MQQIKYKFFIFLLFFLLLPFYQCKKGAAEFILKGTITDATLNHGHANASISLYKVPAGSSEKILIENQILGENGDYSFTFQREAIEKYVIMVEKENYFLIEENIYFSTLTTTQDNIRDYSTSAKSWVKLKFKNDNPQSNDHFRYIKQEGKVDCIGCCPSDEQNYYGDLDTSIYCINDANTNYSIYYWVIGTPEQNLLSVNTSIFDTTEISLNY